MDLSVVKPEGQTFSGPRTIDPDPNPPTDSAGKDAVRPSPVNLAAFLPPSLPRSLLPSSSSSSSGFSADLLSPITVSEPISSFEMDEREGEQSGGGGRRLLHPSQPPHGPPPVLFEA